MYFSYEQHSMINLFPLSGQRVRDIIAMNRKGIKPDSLKGKEPDNRETDFVSAVGDDSISRFDEKRRSKRKKQQKRSDRNKQQRSEDEKTRQDTDPREGKTQGDQSKRRQGQRGGGRRRDQGKPRDKSGEKRESSENQ